MELEDQHGWKLEDYQVQLVYHNFIDHEEKTFMISIELRDYGRRYCVMANLSEEMFVDLIRQYEEAKSAGYVYNNLGTKFRKGESMQ